METYSYDIIRFHNDGGDSRYGGYQTKEQAERDWKHLKKFVSQRREDLRKSGVLRYHFRGPKPEDLQILEV